jgi:hypothetical protein
MDFLQIGGACSLCGADGTNKTTCPLNKDAKNPNAAKHNAGKKANVKAANVKAANVKAANAKPVVKKVAVKKEKVTYIKTKQYHNVLIDLRDDDNKYIPDIAPDYTGGVANKIVSWYAKRISSEHFMPYIKDFSIEYVQDKKRKNLFSISYKQIAEFYSGDNDELLADIINPDVQGSHLIKIGGAEYYVSAKLLN